MAGNPFDLTGRRALVTGGSGGIGSGLARALVEAGATVASWAAPSASTRSPPSSAASAIRADLGDRDDLRRGFADAVERLGGVDVLVNAHGIGRASEAVEHTSSPTGTT